MSYILYVNFLKMSRLILQKTPNSAFLSGFLAHQLQEGTLKTYLLIYGSRYKTVLS